MNIFVAFFVLLLLLAESTPPAASSIPLIGNYLQPSISHFSNPISALSQSLYIYLPSHSSCLSRLPPSLCLRIYFYPSLINFINK